jgi:hypothetical protein
MLVRDGAEDRVEGNFADGLAVMGSVLLRGRSYQLVAFAGVGAEVFCEFVRHVYEGIGVRRCRLLLRDVGPKF